MISQQPAAKSAYAAAGVNIDNKMEALKAIKTMIGSTKTVNVVGGIGSSAACRREARRTRSSSPPRTASAPSSRSPR